jgi:hypothetical protein
MPRGLRHSFEVVGSEDAKMVVVTAPAGIERFLEEIDQLGRQGALPPTDDAGRQMLSELYAKHGQTLVDPDSFPTASQD